MRQRYHIGPGAASLVMIVVVLCLTVLGILMWTAARADLRLSQRDYEMQAGYYEADARAQETLAQIDSALYAARSQADSWADYLERVDRTLPEGVAREGDRVTYAQQAGAQRVIMVELQMNGLEAAQRYRLAAWSLADQMDWEEDG